MRERKFAPFVRLEVDCEMPAGMALRLTEELQLSRDDVYRVCGPMALGGERIFAAKRSDLLRGFRKLVRVSSFHSVVCQHFHSVLCYNFTPYRC